MTAAPNPSIVARMIKTLRARKLVGTIFLLVFLAVYIVFCVRLMTSFERLPFFLELIAYIALGVCWAFRMKPLFKWIGRGVS